MSSIHQEKLFSAKWFKSYSFILIGTFIMAMGFVFFISPYKLAPGGVYGIAIILHHLFGFPIGLSGLAMDIPLTIIAILVLGPKFGTKTIFGFILLSAWITLLEFAWGYTPLVEGDALLSAIFGGALVGIGLGLVFKSKASSGGSDIVAMIIAKYTKLPLGQLMIAVDAAIVLLGLIAFDDWKIPLYSWIVIFITGKIIDTVLEGVNYEKTCLIISEKPEEIRDKIIHDLGRGGTFIKAQGMYSEQDKRMIFTVVNRREMVLLQEYVHEIDPSAFITIINTNEIYGEGFRSLGEKVNS